MQTVIKDIFQDYTWSIKEIKKIEITYPWKKKKKKKKKYYKLVGNDSEVFEELKSDRETQW